MNSSLAASYAAAVAVLLAAPFALTRYVARHLGVEARTAVRGALGFVVAQLALALALVLLQPVLGGRVVLVLCSAAVEESARWWALRRVRPAPGGARGLCFAMGWGGCEVALAGLSTAFLLGQLLYGDPDRLQGPEAEAARQYLLAQRPMLSAPAWAPLLGVVERAGIACVQLLLTALVLRALRGGGAAFFAAALACHVAVAGLLAAFSPAEPVPALAPALLAVALGLAALPAALAIFRRVPPEPA